MKAARHPAREKRDGVLTRGTQIAGDTAASLGAHADNNGSTAMAPLHDTNTMGGARESSSTNQVGHGQGPRAGKDVFSAAKMPDVIDVRRNAMAYWRKNTNSERPSDLHYYTSLTSPAGYNWQNPFLADAAGRDKKQPARAGLPGSDLSSLAAFITSNSKNYLAGMHARNSQNELEGQEFDSLRSGEDLSPAAPQDFASYPHYDGGWEAEIAHAPYRINSQGNFEPLPESSLNISEIASDASEFDPEVISECGVEEIIADDSVPLTLAAQSAQTASLFSAAGDALSHHMDIDFAPSVDAPVMEGATANSNENADEYADENADENADEYSKDLRTNHAWTVSTVTGSPVQAEPEPQALTEELSHSLSSIESSPQCDLLFEQSAAAAGAIFKGALPMRTLDAQSQAEQSTTLDNLPEQQFVDVRISAADSGDTDPEILRALAYDINPDVRFAIAENHNVDEEILCILAADENPYVAHRARKTLQRLEGGQVKQGNFVQKKTSNWTADRRKST